MHPYDKNWQRLPLQGAVNARDLGGYPAQGTAQTAWHRFVRSDALSDLTDSDIEFLRGYGVGLVIDLRGQSEAQERPDRPLGPGITYTNITLVNFDAASAHDMKQRLAHGISHPGEAYVQILQSTSAMARVIRAILATPPTTCVLFHCQAGKDRTGALSMVLLDLAGVARWDIITNYAQTSTNLMRLDWYPRELERAGNLRDLLDSLPTTIAYAYDYLHTHYGSAQGYLTACGLSPSEIQALRSRLLA